MTITAATFGLVEEETAWTLPVRHLSASSLKMAMRCPEQWRQRYVHHRKERPGAAGTLGSAEWNAHVANYEQKMKTGVDLPESELENAYAASWDQAVEKNGGLNEIAWGESKWTDVQMTGLRMAKVYHAQVSPRTEPVAVEKKIEFEVAGIPVPILGYIDLVKAHSTVEHKTGKTVLRVPKSEWIFQQRIYSLHTKMPGEIHLVSKAKEPKVVTPLESPAFAIPTSKESADATASQLAKSANFLNYLYSTLGPDEPWPTFGVISDWACGWCAYRGECPAWRS